MRLVSPLLKHAVYPALHHIGWLDRMAPSGCAVVNYHGVVPADHIDAEPFLDGNLVGAGIFHEQLRFLKAHYHVTDPEDFRAGIEQGKPLPPRSVLVTCDDGLLNTLTDMLPVLQSESVKCLFFVTAASCRNDPAMLWYEELYQLMRMNPLSELNLPNEGEAETPSPENFQARWWSAVRRSSKLSASDRTDWMRRVRTQCNVTQNLLPTRHAEGTYSEKRWRLLNLTELRQLSDAGMSIGAHTLSHPVLSVCGEEEVRREIRESRVEIENALGRTVWAFAYPFGNPATMGEREVRLAREAGFSCAFLNVEHWSNMPSSRFALPRTHVTSQTTLPEFAAHLSGLHNRLQRVVGG
jgi:peptidoglycan/xylan/chitin deacetylase (PgdA/CDA1 family)